MSTVNEMPLTTGKIAKMCRVAPRTVSKWIDSGQLEGYRIPMSKDRRVFPSKLRAFLLANGNPVPNELNKLCD